MKKVKFILFSLICFCFVSLNVKAYDRTIDDGIYIIHSAINDNYVLDANGAIATNGTNIQLYQNNGGLSQKWIVKYLDNGYYEIKSTINDNYALDVNGAIFNNSVNIQLWQNNSSPAQKWYIKDVGNGYYKLISYNQNYALDANGAVARNFTNIQLWDTNDSLAQQFRFEKIYNIGKTIENGVYTISTPLVQNKNVDVYGGYIRNNANIQLYDAHNGDAQKYYVTYLDNGFYSIRAYLDINYSFNVNNKGNIELSKYNNSNLQQWLINKSNNGDYNIISKKNYKVMDIYGALTKNETNIETYTYNNGLNQRFIFNKINTIGSKTVENGYYFINSSLNLKKVLDINNGIMEDKRNIEIYDFNYGINQKWYLEYLNNGYYKIIANKNRDYVLQTDSSNVNIGIYNGLDSQQWAIKKNSYGYYIVSKTGNYLDLYYGDTTNGTNIQIYPFNGGKGQIFNFIKTADGISDKVLEDGIYRISSALNNNMFIDVNGASKANGTNVQLWTRNTTVAQKFRVTYLSNGYYKINTLVDLNKSIDVEYASIKNGTNVSIYEDANSINQQWIIKDAGDGYFNIISNCNNLYLDVENSGTKNGTNILLWQENGGKNQKFKFIKSSKDTKVMDVSYHQGDIDWNKVANSGIYGVILRIGYWETEDSRFSEYISEVKRLGIPYGIYLFSYASTINGANIEANFTNKIIDKYNLNPVLGVYYDIEDWYTGSENSYGITKEQYDSIINTYIGNVSSRIGNKYKVKVYANTSYANNRLSDSARSQVDWIADYRSQCGYKGIYSMWQYTDAAEVDGVRGYVDMSYLH